MARPRMIQTQFGAVNYDSGVVSPNTGTPVSASVVFEKSGPFGVDRHNDVFYVPNGLTSPLQNFIHFATYDYIDLRDLVEEKSGLDDVTINIQRLDELPYPDVTYNMPPGNIYETILVVLGDLNLETSQYIEPSEFRKLGFDGVTNATTGEKQAGLPFEVLYRENRTYVQDPSQNFVSPDQIGSQAGLTGDATQAPTRFVGNYRLNSRTIGGYPDMIVGPGLTIIRVCSVYPAFRLSQSLDGGGPTDAPADEYTFLQSKVQCKFTPFQLNIVGTQRKLTATETATYYSNILNNRSV